MRLRFRTIALLVPAAIFLVFLTGGCTGASTKAAVGPGAIEPPAEKAPKYAAIEIAPNSPAETVKVFYQKMREGKFREALFLTNLRPAIEGLTESELKEFQVDFDSIAKHIPAEVQINGEIVSANRATVTARLPGEDLDKYEVQQIRLRKEGDYWIILTVDEAAEKVIKEQGRNYFYSLRIKSHEDDAKEMLDRVAKAQMAYAAQNGGIYAGMEVLISAELLPGDIRSNASTGYDYVITVAADKKSYAATATPAVYGKTGRRSFSVELSTSGMPHLTSRDAGEKTK
ncbi:MAG: hypothetical protein ABI539_07295 [Acidobacteriota bacterium]